MYMHCSHPIGQSKIMALWRIVFFCALVHYVLPSHPTKRVRRRGPYTMLPLLKEARKVCKGPLAALPVPLRTNDTHKSFQSLMDPITGKGAYPLNTSQVQCTREEIRAFAEEARQLGINYIGLCCGNASMYIRELALVYGKSPPSLKYEPDLRHTLVVGEIAEEGRGKKIRKHFSGWM